MAKVSNPETLTWNGASPLQSNVSAHSVDEPRSFVQFVDLVTDGAKRIRKRAGKGTAVGANAGSAITALHEFERIAPTTGLSTYYRFRSFGTKIQRESGGAWADETLPYTPTSGVQWVFRNHENRCFAVNGDTDATKGQAIVFDGTNWRVVGIDDPVAAATYALRETSSLGRVTIVMGSPTVTETGEALVSLTSVGGTATATTSAAHNLVAGTDQVVIAGAGVGAYNGTFTVATTPTAASYTYTFGGGASPAGGSPTARMVWPTGSTWVSPYMDISGSRYRVSTVDASNTITLTETAREASASGLTYLVYHGLMDWGETPPKYAWSYYNPTTGHVSNRSPITEITEQNRVGTSVVLTVAGSAANTTAYNAGYTQLVAYRTAKDGNQLVRINTTVNNVNSGAAITFTESTNTYLDTFLLKDTAPLTANKKPPTALTTIVVWGGRLWALRPSDPTNTPADRPRTYFSALAGEVPFGVAEESWPRLFARSGIAHPTGLAVVGDVAKGTLVIQSLDGDYTLDGYDNKTFTDPFSIGTRSAGGFLFGAVEVDGRLVQFYRDKRLFDWQQGDLGFPIQDKLNNINAAAITATRLFRYSYQNTNALFITVPDGVATAASYTYQYDYDFKRINEWNFGFSAAATVHNTSTGALELWVGDSAGNVYKLLQSSTYQDAGANFAPLFKTAHINFGRRKRLSHARILVGPNGAEAQTWTLTYYTDEDTTGTTVNFSAAPTAFQSAQGRELVYEFEKPVFSQVFQATVTFPSSNQDLYVERFDLVFDDAQDDEEDS